MERTEPMALREQRAPTVARERVAEPGRLAVRVARVAREDQVGQSRSWCQPRNPSLPVSSRGSAWVALAGPGAMGEPAVLVGRVARGLRPRAGSAQPARRAQQGLMDRQDPREPWGAQGCGPE